MVEENIKQNLGHKKRSPVSWVPTVYFAMGFPFVILNMVASLMFKGLDVSDAKIAFWTSLIMLPWTLKPLWSPFLEMFKTKKYFVLLTQLITGLMFAMVALSLNLSHFFAFAIALFAIIAFSGATHDIATDGIYMTELSKDDQAKYIGWQGAFYNLAKIVASGGLVYLAGYLMEHIGKVNAWMCIMGLCSAVMLLLCLYHTRRLPGGSTVRSEKRSMADTLRGLEEVIVSFFKKRYILLYILFIVLYRLAEGFVIKIAPLFLKAEVAKGGLGLSEQQIGLLYGTFGAGAFVLGSLLAGYFIAARGLKRSLLTLVCAFNIPFAVYTLLAAFQPSSQWLIGAGIMFEYFGYGFGFVGLTLFMMQQVAPGKHQMAHYAFATGIMNLGVMLPGMASGILSDALGYRHFFLYVLLTAIPVFILCRFLPFTYSEEKRD